jgi:galactokinase/mevalonate kinase-like predicted kinase
MVRGTKPTPAWRRMPRASLADVMLRADAEALATLHAHALLHAPWSPRTSAPLAVARRHAALEAIASAPEQRAEARIHAMAAVGAAVERDITLPRPVTTFAVRQDQAVWASAPVRIDLAGGWSDTPPLCIEHGGAVVNAAVTLGGTLPLQAMVRVTEEPAITLHSVDAGRTAHYRSVRELLDHRDPSQWDALPRAALVLSGLVPREPGADLRTHLRRAGGGLAITLFSAVPRGSGLGTSSILGATLLATLDRIAGHATDPAHIARGTSLLEQMISTRGGWQDQVGGLWGGIKLCTTRAGIHQVPDVAPITPPASFTRALHERAVLFYSGQRRMARGILETVVMRYLRGERAVLDARARLVDGAHAMAAAITAGDLDEFGRRLAEYRELKRTVDPASVTPLLEAPIDALGRDVASWSFAGAGGGGFVILLCRSTGAAERVRAQLNRHPPHPLARPFPFDLDAGGMRIAVL